MEPTIQQTKSVSKTQQNMEAYFKTHDIRYVADDAIFINMSSGEETKGKEAIGQMLNYL
jgi:hypothetical protein